MKTLLLGLSVVFIAVIISSIWTDSNSSSFEDHEAFRRLASKTPYEFLKKTHVKAPDDNCEVLASWILIRHGTRYPGQKSMMQITDGLQKLKASYPQFSDFRSILEANNSHQLLDALHPEGEKEMMELAKRFKARFPRLFRDEYDPVKIKFYITKTDRTLKSKYFFTIGLYDKRIAGQIPADTSLESVLRFYKYCPKWKTKYKNIMRRQNELFEGSSLFQNRVLESFSIRHGLDRRIKADEITILYNVCRYGQAWNPRVFLKPWCSLFIPEEMSILEYREDVLDYWEDGYESEINYKPACVLVANVIQSLTTSSQNISSLHFSHSRAIRKFLVLLRILDDNVTFTHDLYEELKHHRKWRGSYTYPFGANLAFVLQQCETSKRIGLYLNENLIKLPGCNGDLWCDFDTFVQILTMYNKDCNLSSLCDN